MRLVNLKCSKKIVNSILSLEDDIFNIPAFDDIGNNLKQKGLTLKSETRKSILSSPACKTCSD